LVLARKFSREAQKSFILHKYVLSGSRVFRAIALSKAAVLDVDDQELA
jgi:hypothetical protein